MLKLNGVLIKTPSLREEKWGWRLAFSKSLLSSMNGRPIYDFL